MLLATDLAVVISAEAPGPPADVPWLLAFDALALGTLSSLHIYRPRFAPRFLEDIGTVIAATAIAAMIVTLARVLFADDPDAAAAAVRVWVFAAVYVVAGRAGTRIVDARRRRAAPIGSRP